ncbi:MAG: hypothetical protein IPM57_12080 [Oligoflexia bacterium]|nr:hypothetical protein [Oligoflexia bacterium]
MTKIFLAILLLFNFSNAQVDLTPALILKMKKITKQTTQLKQHDEYLNLIREAAKQPQTEELVYETLRVAKLTFNFDPHRTSILILIEQYMNNKKLYKSVIKKFDFNTATELLEAFEIQERELKEGNG